MPHQCVTAITFESKTTVPKLRCVLDFIETQLMWPSDYVEIKHGVWGKT